MRLKSAMMSTLSAVKTGLHSVQEMEPRKCLWLGALGCHGHSFIRSLSPSPRRRCLQCLYLRPWPNFGFSSFLYFLPPFSFCILIFQKAKLLTISPQERSCLHLQRFLLRCLDPTFINPVTWFTRLLLGRFLVQKFFCISS